MTPELTSSSLSCPSCPKLVETVNKLVAQVDMLTAKVKILEMIRPSSGVDTNLEIIKADIQNVDHHFNIIQKQLVESVFRKPKEHPAPLFKKAKILPVLLLYNHRICLIAHEIFYNDPPDPTWPTRSSKINLALPSSTSACGHRQPNYLASEAWNKLPVQIREIKAAPSFKTALTQHLLDALV